MTIVELVANPGIGINIYNHKQHSKIKQFIAQ